MCGMESWAPLLSGMSCLAPPSSGRVRVPRPLVLPSPTPGPELRWWGGGPPQLCAPPRFGCWGTCFPVALEARGTVGLLYAAIALLLRSVCSRVCTGSRVSPTDVHCEAAAGFGRGGCRADGSPAWRRQVRLGKEVLRGPRLTSRANTTGCCLPV